MNTNTIIWAQLFEYSNNPNIRGNTDIGIYKKHKNFFLSKNYLSNGFVLHFKTLLKNILSHCMLLIENSRFKSYRRMRLNDGWLETEFWEMRRDHDRAEAKGRVQGTSPSLSVMWGDAISRSGHLGQDGVEWEWMQL